MSSDSRAAATPLDIRVAAEMLKNTLERPKKRKRMPDIKDLPDEEKGQAAMYFFDNMGSDFVNLPEFQKYWSAITTIDFSPTYLALIVHRVAKALEQEHYKEKHVQAHTAHIAKNFANWSLQAEEKMNRFTCRDLAMVMQGLSKIGIKPPPDFMRAWERRARHIFDYFSLQEITTSLVAHGVSGLCPSRGFLDKLDAKIRKADVVVPSDMAVHMLRGLAMIDAQSGGEIKRNYPALIHHLYSHLDMDSMKVSRKNNFLISEACTWFDLPFLKMEKQEEENTQSYEEIRLKQNFQLAGIALDGKPHYIDALDKYPDYYHSKWRQGVILEYDGYSHFVKVPHAQGGGFSYEYNGSTQFQTALIRKVDTSKSLIRLPFYDVDAVKAKCTFKKENGVESLNAPMFQGHLKAIFADVWKYKPDTYVLKGGQIVQGFEGTKLPETQSLWQHISRYI